MSAASNMRFVATKSVGEVGAILLRPGNARGLLVSGHGAGASRRHAFLEAIAIQLATTGTATFRYQFPYPAETFG
ncbi:MAG: alpha/beta family hydrolase [bacterium]